MRARRLLDTRRRTLLMSRLMEISGRNLWIMRTRKACAPGTTTPKDDLDDESYCTASDEFASHSDSLDSELSNPSNEAGRESGL